jgi:N-dimethylarginine dimethylaminohydrolase
MTRAAQILMCPPDYYGIEYEINPWMRCDRPSEHELALRQWQDLRLLLEQVGATIHRLPPVAGLPDLVFTANAAMVCGETAILSHFRYPQRQGEEPHCRQWLAEHGFRVERLDGPAFFEGAGDALFCSDTLFAGYRLRSEVAAFQEIGELVGCRVIPLELHHPYYYHLDTCFCPLAPDLAMYYPGAFDGYGRDALRGLIGRLIAVGEDEAAQFACNAVVVGEAVILGSGCPRLRQQLDALGFATQETPLSEFVKAGGSAKCLTLRLDGEDAATWTLPQPLALTLGA